MIKKQIKSLAILTLFSIIILLSGCTTQGRGLRDGTPTPQGTTMVPPGQQGMMGTGTRQDGLLGTKQGQTGSEGASPLSLKSGTDLLH